MITRKQLENMHITAGNGGFSAEFKRGRVEMSHSRIDLTSPEHIVIQVGTGYPTDLVWVIDRQSIEVNGLDSPEPLELPTLDRKCCADFQATARRKP